MSKPIIAITRPSERAKIANDLVEKLGGEPYLAPTLELRPINSPSLKKLVNKKYELDWIVFTSPTTIKAIYQFYPDFLEDLSCKIAAIGRKTAEVVDDYNLYVDLIPKDFTAEGLLEEFKKRDIQNQVIGIPRTVSARNTLPEGLKELNNKVIIAEAYESLIPENIAKIKELIAKICSGEIDAITFTSPLTVENLLRIAENNEEIASKLSDEILTVAIGPITSNVLDSYNIKNIYPDRYTVKDMLELVMEELE